MEGYTQQLNELCEALEDNNSLTKSQEAQIEQEIIQFQNEDLNDMPLYNICKKIEKQYALLSELLPEEILRLLELIQQKSCLVKTKGTSS